MANYSQQLIKIFDEYTTEIGSAPAALDDVARWALERGKYKPSPRAIIQIVRDDMAEALRQEKRVDADGRVYRAKISVRSSVGGIQLNLWADADLAPRSFVEKSVSQRRRQVALDCFQLKQDVDHFNSLRAPESPIQLILDFSDDVAELEAGHVAGRKRAA